VFGLLLIRNWFLFGTRLYEQGDSGANSILIEQAMRFRLLTGNYSRERFHHPGPGYMYMQAFGEWLLRDAARVVPTAWNGQLVAVFALNSALAAIAVGIVYGWTRSLPGAAAAFAVTLGFAAAHPEILSSGWMASLYVMPFFVFALSAASVAARRGDDLWALAFSGWLLIHGQACFLFFVPVLTAGAAVAALWPSRRSLRMSMRVFLRDQRRAWMPALAVSALFALPIAINLIAHWPGDFGKYLAYGSSGRAGGHTAGDVVRYALWFWWPYRDAWLVPLAAAAVALAVVRTLASGPLRRFLLATGGMTALTSIAFLYYAATGIDYLSEYYIGYFYWSALFLLLLVIAVGLIEAASRQAAVALPAALVTGVLVTGVLAAAAGAVPGLRTSLRDNDPGLPGAVAVLAARDPGKPIVISIVQANAWVDATGFLVQAERTGVRACVACVACVARRARLFSRSVPR
jgi:hypothetical protein